MSCIEVRVCHNVIKTEVRHAGLVLVMFGARPLTGKLLLVIMAADMLKKLKSAVINQRPPTATPVGFLSNTK
jgi:hypothetical protein